MTVPKKSPSSSASADALVALRVGHLQMIQGVIGRMGGSSTALKGFCVTVAAAIVAVKADELGSRLLWLLVLVGLFALCDAGYLRIEADFRTLYRQVASRPLDEAENMLINRPDANISGFIKAMGSWSVLGFYGALAMTVVLIGAFA